MISLYARKDTNSTKIRVKKVKDTQTVWEWKGREEGERKEITYHFFSVIYLCKYYFSIYDFFFL